MLNKQHRTEMDLTGKFVISLDFELLWGVRDAQSIESYGKNILGVWEMLPKLLELFEQYEVSATFATVGFLFASDPEEASKFSPKLKPTYKEKDLDPYLCLLEGSAINKEHANYWFAPQLIDLIKQYPDHEIASHTYSHFYCLEPGQTKGPFRSDTEAAVEIAAKKNVEIKSFIFPRNQINEQYLDVLEELGITSYRGHERTWYHTPANIKGDHWGKRAMRLFDAYLNISGHNCYNLEELGLKPPYNIPSSRFLRPYNPSLSSLEPLRLKRIIRGMEHAARNKKVYHLWWHPHNFGIYQQENFDFLENILEKFKYLNATHGFQSSNMRDLAESLQSYVKSGK